MEEHQIDVEADKWPGSASWVTRRIKEVETNLEHEGVKFSTCREPGTGRSIIILTECEGSEGSESISCNKNMTSEQESVNTLTSKRVSGPENVDKKEAVSYKVSNGDAFTAFMPSQTSQQETPDFVFERISPAEKCPTVECGL